MAEDRPAFPSIKLHRPRTLVGWIVRSRLQERLDQVLQAPVAMSMFVTAASSSTWSRIDVANKV